MRLEPLPPDLDARRLAEENASNGALRRNGFTFSGEVIDPEDGRVWRWERNAC